MTTMAKLGTAFTYSTDATVLAAYIAKIGARAKSLVEDIHITLASAIMHAVEHGDIGYIQKLDNCLNEGFWKRGFRMYVNDFGPVVFVKADKKQGIESHWQYDKAKREAIQKESDAHLAKMLGTPYWKYADQKQDDFEGFDLPKLIGALIGRAERTAKDDKKKTHEKNNWAGLADLQALARKLAAGDAKVSSPPVTSGAPAAVGLVH